MQTPHKQALEYAQQSDWEAAHEIVQSLNDPLACRIHAFLHRQEGDDGNARYWYNRAGVQFPNSTIGEELQALFDSASDKDTA